MPMIRIEFDDSKLEDDEILLLSRGIQKVVKEATHIEEVFVYANSARIKVDVAPIEVFIEMSAHKVTDREALFAEIKQGISKWKKENDFQYPITLTLTPVDWKFEVGI